MRGSVSGQISACPIPKNVESKEKKLIAKVEYLNVMNPNRSRIKRWRAILDVNFS